MFLVRRVCEVERKNVWQVARLLRSMCRAYEENNGRAEATIYVSGTGTPGKDVTVSAEWQQETIEANRIPNVPDTVKKDNVDLQKLLLSYEIEFHEIATDDKIAERTRR